MWCLLCVNISILLEYIVHVCIRIPYVLCLCIYLNLGAIPGIQAAVEIINNHSILSNYILCAKIITSYVSTLDT